MQKFGSSRSETSSLLAANSMQPLNEIINVDTVYGNQLTVRYMTIFYGANSAVSALLFVLLFDVHKDNPDVRLGLLLANVHNILVGLVETLAKTFINRSFLDFYERAFLLAACGQTQC